MSSDMKPLTLEVGIGKCRHNSDVGIDIDRSSDCDVLADAQFLPFRASVFAKVIMIEVLEHVNSPYLALMEIKRTLIPNGRLVFSIPNVLFYRKILRWTAKEKIDVCCQHIYGWSFPEIKNLLEKAGFVVLNHGFCDWRRHNKRSRLASILARVTRYSLLILAKG